MMKKKNIKKLLTITVLVCAGTLLALIVDSGSGWREAIAAVPQGPVVTAGNYRVEIEGLEQSDILAVSGIGITISVVEYTGGGGLTVKIPGTVSVSNITLRSLVPKPEFDNWVRDVVQGNVVRKIVSITLIDDQGTDAVTYTFVDCWPCKWTLGNLDVNSIDPATVDMTLAVDRIQELF